MSAKPLLLLALALCASLGSCRSETSAAATAAPELAAPAAVVSPPGRTAAGSPPASGTPTAASATALPSTATAAAPPCTPTPRASVTPLPTLEAARPEGNGCYGAVAGRFAVVSHPPGQSNDSYFSVITIDADTGEFAQLTEKEDGEPAGAIRVPLSWSPDGCHLAVTLSKPDPKTGAAGYERVHLVDYSGQTRRLLRPEIEKTYEFSPVWSPDARWVAFVSSTYVNEIYLVAVDEAGEVRRLVTLATEMTYELSWSPDGKRLAFARLRKDSECSDIYAVDVDGGRPTQLTFFGSTPSGEPVSPCAGAWGLQWSPDGTQIAFLHRGSVHVMDRTGHNVKDLTEGIERLVTSDDKLDPMYVVNVVESFSWSPDSRRLVLELWVAGNPQIHELYVVDRDGTGLARIGADPALPDQRYPSWGPDGRIVFSAGDGFWIMNGDGSDMHRVGPDLDGWRVGAWWAPVEPER